MGLAAPSSRRNHRREQSGRKSPGSFALMSLCLSFFLRVGLLIPYDSLFSHACEWECKKTLHLEEILVRVSGRPEEDGWALPGVAVVLVVPWACKGHTASLLQRWLFFMGPRGLTAEHCILLAVGPWPKLCNRTRTLF